MKYIVEVERDELKAKTKQTRDEKSTAERRAERRAEAQRRRGTKPKTGRVPCRKRRENTSRNAGGKRSYIGSARARGERGDRSHAHINRDAHLAFVKRHSLERLTLAIA